MENRVKEFEEVRKARRKVQNNTTCRFDSHTMELSIYELSAHGFSFLCRKESCFFKRGAILDKISIFNAEKLEIISAVGTVIHVSEFDSESMRIGVSYAKKSLDRTISGKVRIPRQIPKIHLNVKMTMKNNGDGRLLTGDVMDYTASTARIKFAEDQQVILEVGVEVGLTIQAEEKVFFSGKAYVIRKRDDGTEIIVHFSDQFLDVPGLEFATNAIQNRNIVFLALESLDGYKNINNEFKAMVCDWRLFMKRLKDILDKEEDKNIYSLPSDKEYFVQSIEDPILQTMHGFISRLNDLADALPKEESVCYKRFFKENLNPYFRTAPLTASIIDKFFGYAGDFETIKYFFLNPYSGDTLFSKMMNKFLCSLDAVSAHQDRIQYLYDELCSFYNRAEKEFTFMSLGSGPAEEVLRFVEKNIFNKPVQAALLDMDAYALADISSRLQYLPKENFLINLFNINILNILRREECNPLKRKFQLTYCAGLFDYFTDSICKRLVKYLVNQTESGGYAIITNVHKNSFSRHIMDYGGGWEIIHRDEKELMTLVPPEYKTELHFDINRANIFLKISIPNTE